MVDSPNFKFDCQYCKGKSQYREFDGQSELNLFVNASLQGQKIMTQDIRS